MRTPILLSLLFLPLLGCVGSRAEYLGTERFAPRPDDWPIVLVESEVDIKKPFIKVARIVGSGPAGILASWDDVVDSKLPPVQLDVHLLKNLLALDVITQLTRGYQYIIISGGFHRDILQWWHRPVTSTEACLTEKSN